VQAARLIVRGTVQGVGFRWWAARQASLLDLDGSVRNRFDGSVEIVVAGSEEAVGEFVSLCRTGPPGAEVEEVSSEAWAPPVERGFRIARSAGPG
jgi:acylphosphatase